MKHSTKSKRAHHMWEAEKENGKLRIKRTKHADEESLFAEKQARRTASIKQSQEEAAMACLGVWAATLVDDELLTREIAQPIVARFNAVRPEDAPRVHTWAQIGKVITGQKLAAVKRAVSDGMRTRLVSKSLNVPFLVAAELIDKMDGMDMKVMRAAVASVKQGNRVAAKKYGSIARDIQSAFARFGGMRLAVDDKAKKYFEDYFGPYGVELVADIQRRVRADLAYKWLTKHGVDAAAAEYWSSYFSENGYGAQLVGDVAKRLSPANSKSEEGAD